MKTLINFQKLAFLMLLSLFILSCNDDDDDNMKEEIPSKNIVETALSADALSNLVAALQTADESADNNLVATLSGDGSFTVFAPTNTAFADLFASLDNYDSLEDFDTDEKKNLLAAILTYHVISGVSAKSTDLVNGQELTTVQGESLTVNLDSGVSLMDATNTEANVTSANVMASNGIVHIIDKVLLPQAVLDELNKSNSLVDIVVATEGLSVLKDAVIKVDLQATLGAEGPFTVLAPTNDAFAALLDALGDNYNSLDDFDTEEELMLLKNILLYHVIPAKVLAADLAAGMVATAYPDNNIEIIASGDAFVIGDASDTNATIGTTDIMASNGVAHTIDKVLLPQAAIDFVTSLTAKNIVELAVATDDLSLLVGALQQADAGLVAILQGDGPFTVFAPSNDAFVALLAALGDNYNSLADFDTQAEKDLLRDILLFHVIPSEIMASDLTAGMVATAYAENSIEVIASGETFVIGDASESNTNITAVDIKASNGVVHLIDKVLLPQAAVDFAASL
ncbi:fasciclin domain-containing protein [Arenibacter amylolyticus]|uniref:fasciclin domain-containing protein n=1 Tax=Arenibacter amylolyticus TaxID=1406873 RepID=UPI000A3C0BF5|nr:fasciclin domain-containing protein [Arenibacter amylolyticus]